MGRNNIVSQNLTPGPNKMSFNEFHKTAPGRRFFYSDGKNYQLVFVIKLSL